MRMCGAALGSALVLALAAFQVAEIRILHGNFVLPLWVGIWTSPLVKSTQACRIVGAAEYRRPVAILAVVRCADKADWAAASAICGN